MRSLFLILATVVLAGCAASSVTDYNPAVVYSQYDSWAFAPKAEEGGFTSLDDRRVREAIRREFRLKAMKELPAAEADLLVDWRIVQEERLEQSGVGLGFGFGYDHFGWGVAAPPPVREITEGKLVVRFADRETDEVVWQAAGRRYLNEDQSPETRRKVIDEVVSDMFSKYPPDSN
jgi:hypothetical protein